MIFPRHISPRWRIWTGLDLLLVGDSLGMCVYGHEGTVPVVMDQMIFHAQAVRRGAPNSS